MMKLTDLLLGRRSKIGLAVSRDILTGFNLITRVTRQMENELVFLRLSSFFQNFEKNKNLRALVDTCSII
jgi:hypothetical protein